MKKAGTFLIFVLTVAYITTNLKAAGKFFYLCPRRHDT
ncbi:unnamed protein product, partial [marine sediment metagenome]